MLVLSIGPAHISTKKKWLQKASWQHTLHHITMFVSIKNLILFQEKVDMDKSVNDHPASQLLSSTQVLKWDKGGLKWDKGYKVLMTHAIIFN